MSNDVLTTTTQDYEARYQSGYGLVYPESHIIRVHRHILQWELKQTPGNMFDFGCGSGSCSDDGNVCAENEKRRLKRISFNLVVMSVRPIVHPRLTAKIIRNRN